MFSRVCPSVSELIHTSRIYRREHRLTSVVPTGIQLYIYRREHKLTQGQRGWAAGLYSVCLSVCLSVRLPGCSSLVTVPAAREPTSGTPGIWGLSRPQGATPRRCRGCCATGAKLHCIISTPPALGLGKVAAVGGGVQVPWLVTVRYLRAAALRGDEWSRLFDHFGQ